MHIHGGIIPISSHTMFMLAGKDRGELFNQELIGIGITKSGV